jgi:hypothetical protein
MRLGDPEWYPGKLGIKKASELSSEQREVERRAAERLEADCETFIEAYRKLYRNLLSTDAARELFPEYSASREARAKYAAAVQEPASALIKEIWRRMLQETDPSGDNDVLFLAGGAGSGKSSIARDVPGGEALTTETHIVYDTTLSDYASAVRKINQALNAGKFVQIIYVHRLIEGATRGVVARAVEHGRTVPLKVLARDHFNAQRTLFRLIKHYNGDDRVRISVVDNRGRAGEARWVPPTEVQGNLYTSVREVLGRAKEVVDYEYYGAGGAFGVPGGRSSPGIPEYVYRGIVAGTDTRASFPRAGRASSETSRPQSQSQRPPQHGGVSGRDLPDRRGNPWEGPLIISALTVAALVLILWLEDRKPR